MLTVNSELKSLYQRIEELMARLCPEHIRGYWSFSGLEGPIVTRPKGGKTFQKNYFTARETVFINLSEAYLCSDCEAVGNSASRCPRCQSNALFAVARVIPHHCDSIRIVCPSVECVPIDEPRLKAA